MPKHRLIFSERDLSNASDEILKKVDRAVLAAAFKIRDEMQTWEINDMIENIPYTDRALWETARVNAYVVAQVNSKKKLTQQDILKFKWEDMSNFMHEEHIIEMSNADINRLEELSKNFKNVKWEDIDAKT